MPNLLESAASLFGYAFVRKQDDVKKEKVQQSFTQRENDDGSAIITASGSLGSYVDLDGTLKTEADLIGRYREISILPDVDMGINEIVNEAITIDEKDVVKIDLDDVPATDPVKEALQTCFEEVLDLLEFNQRGYHVFHRWYVDGRINYHAIIDESSEVAAKEGIKELRYIDPRKLRRVREVERTSVNKPGVGPVPLVKVKAEYFMYNENGFNTQASQSQNFHPAAQGLKIAVDSIISVTSGVTDPSGQLIYSNLHKAIKPTNVLRAVEDAVVIYRLSRAPERRVWYIDVGNLPKAKAEQYVRDVMNKQKNKLAYNATNGEIQDQRKFLSMLEDFYLPRSGGGKGTEVQTLPSGSNLSQMDDVEYFQRKLYQSLNVPISRLQPGDAFTIGRATEITRDEVAFGKFITRLRNRFSKLFLLAMEKQVTLKQVMSLEDWRRIAPRVKFDYANDNYFMEMKESEVIQNRMMLLQQVSPWIGRYYSNQWVEHNILRKTDDEIAEEKVLIEAEKDDPIYSQPMPGQDPGMDPGMEGMGPEEFGGGDPSGEPFDGSEPNDEGDPNEAPDEGSEPPQQRRDFKRKKPGASLGEG